MTGSKYKYILIGVLVVVTTAIFVFGLNFLKGKNFFIDEDVYYVVYDRIEGLSPSSPVQLNGYNVGQVRSIEFNDLIKGDLIVKFVVEKKISIPKNTTARIFSLDLMGTKAIQLVFSDSLSKARVGDTLVADTEESLKEQVSIEMLPLKNKAEDLLKEMETAIKVINTIFNEETQRNLQQTIKQLSYTAQHLNSSSASLDTMLQNEKQRIHRLLVNMESITRNFAQNGRNVTELLTNLKGLSDSLRQVNYAGTFDHIDSTLVAFNAVLASIEDQQGTMGKLIYNDSLYNTLNRSTDYIGALANDLRINPKRYLHFSVFDLGRTMYVLDNDKMEKKASKSADVYYILIDKSDKPIPLENFEIDYQVEQHLIDNTYLYTIGVFESEKKARKQLEKEKKTIPEAQLVKINKSQYEVVNN